MGPDKFLDGYVTFIIFIYLFIFYFFIFTTTSEHLTTELMIRRTGDLKTTA